MRKGAIEFYMIILIILPCFNEEKDTFPIYNEIINLFQKTEYGSYGVLLIMEDVLDKIENRGIEKGANDIWSLVQKLFAEGRRADAERASKDEEFRAKLMKEFGMAVVK